MGMDQKPDWYIANYDPVTCDAPNVDTELGRLKELKRYNILDHDRQACYESAASLCSHLLGAPIAIVNLIDLGRASMLGSAGLPLDTARDCPRQTSMCAHTILSREAITVVPDTTKDPRFAENPFVTGPTNVRFYAGAPLVARGHKLGTISVFDTKARPEGLTPLQQDILKEMAELVMAIIEKTTVVEDTQNKTMGKRSNKSSSPTPVSSEVETTVTFLRNDLAELSEDSHLQKHMTPRNKRSLQSAFESAKYLYTSLVEIQSQSQSRSRTAAYQKEREEATEVPPLQAQQPEGTVGRITLLDIHKFINSLQFVMDSFPNKIHLVFSVDPSVPEIILANDLKVFRSAISLLTHGCERTERGFVRLTIKLSDDAENKHVVFECEDTGPDVDIMECEKMFAGPTEEEFEDCEEDSCIHVDKLTGEIQKNHVCQSDPRVSARDGRLAVNIVAEYISSIGGKYGCRPRVADNNFYDPGTGSVLWFSIPLSLPSHQKVTKVQEAISSKHELFGRQWKQL